jgi:hypothetical protein
MPASSAASSVRLSTESSFGVASATRGASGGSETQTAASTARSSSAANGAAVQSWAGPLGMVAVVIGVI